MSKKFLHLRWIWFIGLGGQEKRGDLLDRITGARTNFAKEMGMLLPTIGVRDSIELEPTIQVSPKEKNSNDYNRSGSSYGYEYG